MVASSDRCCGLLSDILIASASIAVLVLFYQHRSNNAQHGRPKGSPFSRMNSGFDYEGHLLGKGRSQAPVILPPPCQARPYRRSYFAFPAQPMQYLCDVLDAQRLCPITAYLRCLPVDVRVSDVDGEGWYPFYGR